MNSTTDNVVIADDNGVESIAGIMGGEHSGCDENTTDVLIESALWDPMNIARSGRNLGIVTDARYRFERGVDPAFCVPGAELATHLVMELCGGEPSQLIVAGEPPRPAITVDFPFCEVKRLTGLEVSSASMVETLEKLGFAVKNATAERAQVIAPSWRPDIEGKADIVEEIVRIAGVDNVASTPFMRAESTIAEPILTPLQKRTRMARRALASQGLVEAVTWSFISSDRAKLFGGGKPELALANPIAAELSDMRPSLVPGLLAAAQRNADRGFGDVALFEVGQVFKGAGERDQRIAAAAVRRGTAKAHGAGRHWSGKAASVDVFDAKADAMAMLAALGVPLGGMQIVPGGPDFLHPGRSATLQFGPKTVLGWFGELHPRALEALDVSGPVCAFEIHLDELPAQKAKATRAKPKLDLSEFMPLERDFAFVVDRAVKAADIVRAAQGAEKTLIAGVDVFDVYEGAGVPDGQKSVAIAVRLQPREKTLTEAEIDEVASRIVAEVARRPAEFCADDPRRHAGMRAAGRAGGLARAGPAQRRRVREDFRRARLQPVSCRRGPASRAAGASATSGAEAVRTVLAREGKRSANLLPPLNALARNRPPRRQCAPPAQRAHAHGDHDAQALRPDACAPAQAPVRAHARRSPAGRSFMRAFLSLVTLVLAMSAASAGYVDTPQCRRDLGAVDASLKATLRDLDRNKRGSPPSAAPPTPPRRGDAQGQRRFPAMHDGPRERGKRRPDGRLHRRLPRDHRPQLPVATRAR